MIELAVTLDDTEQFTDSATYYIQKMLTMAALTILRIVRSQLRQAVDEERGRRAYFNCIRLERKISIQDSDLASRTTVILTQLWTSKNCFRQPDGSIDSLTLLCRSRLGMSLVFDCFWRWRREFAGQTTPYESISPRGMAQNTLKLDQSDNIRFSSLLDKRHGGNAVCCLSASYHR